MYEELVVGQSFRYSVLILDMKNLDDSNSVISEKACEWKKICQSALVCLKAVWHELWMSEDRVSGLGCWISTRQDICTGYMVGARS